MAKKKDTVKIHVAATYFVFVSRRLDKIAKALDLSERTIRRWRDDDPEWEKALDACRYTGTRLFKKKPTRNTSRDAGADYEKAKTAYIKARDLGTNKSKLATIAGEQAGVDRRKVRDWARRDRW